jgi:hypothetical protein
MTASRYAELQVTSLFSFQVAASLVRAIDNESVCKLNHMNRRGSTDAKRFGTRLYR